MYYFIGIKGSGMGPLACILKELGNDVAGSDIEKFIFIQEELDKRNIPYFPFAKNNIKDGYTVIIGNAFNRDNNEEVRVALDNPKVKTYKFVEFLAEFMQNYISISIAGTHGKTTTTGMAYHLFKDFDKTSVLIGDGVGHGTKDSKYFIMETDEFEDHFLNYYPNYAIINNIELDHVDYFHNMERYLESFTKFANQVKDTVIVWGDDPNIKKLKINKRVIRFGLKEDNDVVARNLIESKEGLSFDVYIHGDLFGHFAIPFYGTHMLYNSLAIISLGYLENMEYSYILKQLQTFKGTRRRYEIREKGNCIFVDDYAHHPTAIKYVIEATRIRYPDKKIVAVFKPDRFSRGFIFQKEFAREMDKADYPFFCAFPDNAKKEEGIDIDIYDITRHLPRAKVIKEDDEAAKKLAEFDNVVYLFMSSKDIYKLMQKVISYKK